MTCHISREMPVASQLWLFLIRLSIMVRVVASDFTSGEGDAHDVTVNGGAVRQPFGIGAGNRRF